MNESIKQLILKFNRGEATPEEEAQLEYYIEQGLVEIEQLEELNRLGNHLEALGYLQNKNALHHNFQQLLKAEKNRLDHTPTAVLRKFFQTKWTFSPALQAALMVIILGLGFMIGYYMRPNQSTENQELAQISNELNTMKEMMMLTLLENESTPDRLKAVKMSEELGDASEEVNDALLQTLNNDKSVNVRLAALESLYQYADREHVRAGLIRSIRLQNSPLVQMALADVMAALQEKRSVKEFEKILKSNRSPEEVKEKIKDSIQPLL
ncbi:MAG: HEAT repeat domain-containing protein [Saprospiraceae bacterium]